MNKTRNRTQGILFHIQRDQSNHLIMGRGESAWKTAFSPLAPIPYDVARVLLSLCFAQAICCSSKNSESELNFELTSNIGGNLVLFPGQENR